MTAPTSNSLDVIVFNNSFPYSVDVFLQRLWVIWGQCFPRVAAAPSLPNGPITQLSPYLTRKPGIPIGFWLRPAFLDIIILYILWIISIWDCFLLEGWHAGPNCILKKITLLNIESTSRVPQIQKNFSDIINFYNIFESGKFPHFKVTENSPVWSSYQIRSFDLTWHCLRHQGDLT